MFKDESLNLCGVWRGLTGVINLCPNCYQRVEATAWGSMQIQQKKKRKNSFDLTQGIIFVSVLIPLQNDTNEWESLHFSAKCQAAVIFSGKWWVGGWILTHLLALLAVYLHVLAIFPVSPAHGDSQCMSTHCACAHKHKLLSLSQSFAGYLRQN